MFSEIEQNVNETVTHFARRGERTRVVAIAEDIAFATCDLVDVSRKPNRHASHPTRQAPPAPDIAQWFAHAYDEPQVRVLRSHERTTGALFMLEGKNGAFWLRIGGVMRREIEAVEAEGRIVSDLAADAFRLAKPLKRVVCHGDLRLGNVSFSGEQPTLFDFEALALAPPAYDLACLWRRRVIECGMTESIPDWDSFLRAYERGRPPVDAERHLVKLLAILRAVWTMSLPAQPGAMWGADWVRDPAYWRDHIEMVRWFARAAQI